MIKKSLLFCLIISTIPIQQIFSQMPPTHVNEQKTRSYYDQRLITHKSDLKAFILRELDQLAYLPSLNELNAFLSALEATSMDDKKTVLEIFRQVLAPDEDLEESYPHIYMISDLVGMGLDVSEQQLAFIQNIFRSLEIIDDEIKQEQIQQQTYLSAEEVKQISSQPVTNEWAALKNKDFIQGPEASACALYSLLYAIKRTKGLNSIFRRQILSKITKDAAGSYYVLRTSEPSRVFTQSFLASSDPLMHPASSSLIKALGYLVLEKMAIKRPDFYVIADSKTGRDFIFGQPIQEIGREIIFDHDALDHLKNLTPSQVVLQKDGSVLFEKAGEQKKLSGDFVLSVASNRWGGHGVALFFDKKESTWKLYDNLRGVLKLTPKNLPAQSIQGIFAVGYMQQQ